MIHESSRFKGELILFDDDNLQNGEEIQYLTPFREAIVSPEEDDFKITFKKGMRVDLLAHEYYEDVHLDWVIMDANPKYFSPFDIQVGDLIVIPNPERVLGDDEED